MSQIASADHTSGEFIVADDKKAPSAEDNKIDHYVRMGSIAMGKHAQVLEVQEENTTNRFAMKVLLTEAMLDPEQVAILKYEGKVAQSLDHPQRHQVGRDGASQDQHLPDSGTLQSTQPQILHVE